MADQLTPMGIQKLVYELTKDLQCKQRAKKLNMLFNYILNNLLLEETKQDMYETLALYTTPPFQLSNLHVQPLLSFWLKKSLQFAQFCALSPRQNEPLHLLIGRKERFVFQMFHDSSV